MSDTKDRMNFQLLEAVQSVHKAVQSNSGGEEEPPLPPYPDVRNLRLDDGKHQSLMYLKHKWKQ